VKQSTVDIGLKACCWDEFQKSNFLGMRERLVFIAGSVFSVTSSVPSSTVPFRRFLVDTSHNVKRDKRETMINDKMGFSQSYRVVY
jgi:hypothetical protein